MPKMLSRIFLKLHPLCCKIVLSSVRVFYYYRFSIYLQGRVSFCRVAEKSEQLEYLTQDWSTLIEQSP